MFIFQTLIPDIYTFSISRRVIPTDDSVFCIRNLTDVTDILTFRFSFTETQRAFQLILNDVKGETVPIDSSSSSSATTSSRSPP